MEFWYETSLPANHTSGLYTRGLLQHRLGTSSGQQSRTRGRYRRFRRPTRDESSDAGESDENGPPSLDCEDGLVQCGLSV